MAKTIFRVVIGILLTWIVNMIINYTIALNVQSVAGWCLLLIFVADLLVDIPLWGVAYKHWNLFVCLNLLCIWLAGIIIIIKDVVNMIIVWFADRTLPNAGNCWMLLLALALITGIYLCARFYFSEHKKDPSGLIML